MERQNLEFYRRVQQGYNELSLAEPERIRQIDGRGPADQVAAAVESAVASFLKSRRQ